MKFKKPFTYTALTLSLLTLPVLSACSKEANSSKAKDQQEAKAEGKQTSLKTNVEAMQASLKKLQESLQQDDRKQVKQYGTELNEKWLSAENEIREKYPLLYTDAEKYLQPLYTEAMKETVDKTKAQDLSVQLSRSLENLKNPKQTAMKNSEALQKAVEEYSAYVNEQTASFVTTTKAFTEAVKAKNMEQAKQLYGASRVYYERIEPIAESFGDLDPRIDAREGDVAAEEWSGFHRIEKALWVDGSLTGMEKYADQLNQDVTELQTKIKGVKLEPTQVVAGAMELLNEAAISKITGEEERYSHIDLVDLAANVEGSQAIYHAILPALNEKNAELAKKLDEQFNGITASLAKYKQGDSYMNYTSLTKEQVRELSQQLSALSELMAQTAEIF
ncbi:iron uptake system protein EfeO [Ectobacillus ponti]|uniref:Tetratricopeptide repeat protein n=1 Tax=Ectobacillus ponti TaxID=2961894 RepID=A0AA41X775_9BACI|nr:iron uptake system protein EfeO [Ectobacillus ponti]MCP8970199.1 tetratricopeptide repeat protein [Ectobacillus ponti]